MRQLIDSGWDSRAWIVDGVWLDREPRRPRVAERLRAETRLMAWLAPELPLAVPVPTILRDEPLRVRHRLIVGRPIRDSDDALATVLGTFVRALHGVSTGEAVRRGAEDVDESSGWLLREVDRMRAEVLPLLDGPAADAGARLLDRCAAPPPVATLVHGDLGPDHILVADGMATGIIDWTDAHIGDPALDLAWLLHGTPARFASAVAEAYGADEGVHSRANAWHRLGPWHEVLYGLDTGRTAMSRAGSPAYESGSAASRTGQLLPGNDESPPRGPATSRQQSQPLRPTGVACAARPRRLTG